MEFGFCPLLHPHTLCVICHYIQVIVWSSVAAWLSWPRLDNCLCFTQTERERICRHPQHSQGRICVPLCGLVQVPRLGLRCRPEISNRISHVTFLLPLHCEESVVCLPLSCLFFCLISVMFTLLRYNLRNRISLRTTDGVVSCCTAI